ncbi:MAG: putative MFS family arabinose efflux permease [Candidatus Azotimanducaceae bacterium]
MHDLLDPKRPKKPASNWYSWFVLFLLVCVYTVNWIDRYVFVILMESIKQDLGLSDAVLGALSGLAFAVIYSIAAIPIARWADQYNRRSIIAIGLGFWSLMTAACGLAANAVQLGMARLGVGLGEAACSPPAHSLISDYFPSRQRATAFAIYGLGVSFGITLGLFLGGWINEHYGWRIAFMAVGAPGILLAIVIRFAIREPKRGSADAGPVDSKDYSFLQVARYLFSRPAFVSYGLGLGLFNLSAFAFDNWSPVFLIRLENMDSAQVGAWTGFLGGPAGLLGTICVGIFADFLSKRDLRWYLWITMVVIGLMIPAILLFLFVPGKIKMLFYFVSIFCIAGYLAPFIAITQRLVPLHMRAISSAVLFVFLNIFGGIGPFIVGVLNDLFENTFGLEAIKYSIAIVQSAGLIGIALIAYGAYRLPRDFKMQFSVNNSP